MLINIEDFNFVHFAGGEVHLNATEFFKVLPEVKLSNASDVIWAPIHDSVDLMFLQTRIKDIIWKLQGFVSPISLMLVKTE